MLIVILLNFSPFGMENHSFLRRYSIFETQLHLEVFCDEVKILVIDVDLDSLQFSTSVVDCKLDVFVKEFTYIVKLRSFLLGDC